MHLEMTAAPQIAVRSHAICCYWLECKAIACAIDSFYIACALQTDVDADGNHSPASSGSTSGASRDASSSGSSLASSLGLGNSSSGGGEDDHTHKAQEIINRAVSAVCAQSVHKCRNNINASGVVSCCFLRVVRMAWLVDGIQATRPGRSSIKETPITILSHGKDGVCRTRACTTAASCKQQRTNAHSSLHLHPQHSSTPAC